MSDISLVLTNLGAIENSILADDGSGYLAGIRVYATYPTLGEVLDPPCWLNGWTFQEDTRGPFGVGRLVYLITATLFMGDATEDIERQLTDGRIAHTGFVSALRQNMTLSGAATAGHTLRGGDPTEGITERGSRSYLTYTHILEVPLWESAEFALGI